MSQVERRAIGIFLIFLGFMIIIFDFPFFILSLLNYGLRWLGIQIFFLDGLLLGSLFILAGKILMRKVKEVKEYGFNYSFFIILGIFMVILNIIGVIETRMVWTGLEVLYIVPLGFFIFIGIIIMIYGIFYRKSEEIRVNLEQEIPDMIRKPHPNREDFKKEVIKKLRSRSVSTIQFLIIDGYLKYLDKTELDEFNGLFKKLFLKPIKFKVAKILWESLIIMGSSLEKEELIKDINDLLKMESLSHIKRNRLKKLYELVK